MRNHIYQYMNVSKLIETYKPKLILELGAAGLQATIQLWGLMYKMGFHLLTVDDNPQTIEVPDPYDNMWHYYQGISYNFLDVFPDFPEIPGIYKDKFDMVLIDTDHNYWTLNREIKALEQHLSDEAVVIFHDTSREILYDTISHKGYAGGHYYPRKEIEASNGKPMVDAIDEWLARSDYKIIKETPHSQGCIAVSKKRKWL